MTTPHRRAGRTSRGNTWRDPVRRRPAVFLVGAVAAGVVVGLVSRTHQPERRRRVVPEAPAGPVPGNPAGPAGDGVRTETDYLPEEATGEALDPDIEASDEHVRGANMGDQAWIDSPFRRGLL